MIRSSKVDMISENLSPVSRNQIWREHVGKESSHSVLREEFSINPRSALSSCVADKPHSSYSQRLTHAAYASLSARTAAKFEERKHLNNGLLHTSRAPCSVGGGGPSTSRMAGSEIMSPRKAEVVQAFAAEVAARRAVAEAARPDSQILHMDTSELLFDLHGKQMTPREKFAHAQTSNQEYGWISEPLISSHSNDRAALRSMDAGGGLRNSDTGYVGRTSSNLTQYVDTYVARHHVSPFHMDNTLPSGHHSHQHGRSLVPQGPTASRRKR